MGAAQEAQACLAFYRGLGRREPLRGLGRALLAFLQKLQQFAGASVKRCKDKNLEEALLLFQELSEGLWELDDADVLPLVRCVLAFQMETTSSSSSFHKLEQIVTKLSEGKESLVAEEVNKLMSSLTEYKQVLSPGELQTVCMFIEESSLGRHHWRLSLAPLLLRVAATLNWVLQDPMARCGEWSYVTVKTCLQLFQAMPKEVSPLVWSEAENSEILQSILGSLLQVVMEQTANKDARLLASTAVSMLVNTAAEPERGARAVLTLFQLVDQGPGELRFGELKVETSVLSSDGLARLVLTRGLLTCCKKEILSCRLDSFAPQACLLLDVLFPAVWAVSEEQKDYHYYRFQVFSLWLQRVLQCLPEIRKVKESRMLAENSELLHRLSQFIWNNAESPVEGASEFIHSSFQHLLEIYHLECHHFEDLERPLYEQFLQRIITMPWQVKARYFPLCAILPYVGPEKVLDTYKELPQHLLNCLSTNHLCPAASDVYKTILQQQRKQWIEGEEPAAEEELAQKWALHWLPTLPQDQPGLVRGGSPSTEGVPATEPELRLVVFPAAASGCSEEGSDQAEGQRALSAAQQDAEQSHRARSQRGSRRSTRTSSRFCGVAAAVKHFLSEPRVKLPEEEDCPAAPGSGAGDLHRHLEPRQEEGAASTWVTAGHP